MVCLFLVLVFVGLKFGGSEYDGRIWGKRMGLYRGIVRGYIYLWRGLSLFGNSPKHLAFSVLVN